MALTVASEFNGDVVDEIFHLLVTQNETVDGGHIHIENNIFKQRSIARQSSDNLIQARAPEPSNQGTIEHTERILSPEDLMVYVEFNPNDFREAWSQWHPSAPFVFSALAPSVQASFITLVLEGIGGVDPYMGTAIWQGDIGGGAPPLDIFDGLVVKAGADADTIKEVLTGVIDESNVVAHIEQVYNATPVSTRRSPNYKIFVSDATKEFYWNALMAKASSDANPFHDVSRMGPLTYKGKPVVSLVGMPDDIIIATHAGPGRDSNLYLGLAGPGNDNESVVSIDRKQANSELWFLKVLWGADTQIVKGEELVIGTAS